MSVLVTIQPLAQRPQTERNRPLPTTTHVRRHDVVQSPPVHHGPQLEERGGRGPAGGGPEGPQGPDLPHLYHGAFCLWAEAGDRYDGTDVGR